MTFQDYLNQKCPRRRPIVNLKAEDLAFCLMVSVGGYREVGLEIDGKLYCYQSPIEGGNLRTSDDDGNPRKTSCFVISGEELDKRVHLESENLSKFRRKYFV